MVTTQAMTMRKATTHLMLEKLVVEPTPIIEPAMACVVETGWPMSGHKKGKRPGGFGAKAVHRFKSGHLHARDLYNAQAPHRCASRCRSGAE